jgi:hypothetical protein
MAGVAALGFVLATPAQANQKGLDGSFRVAARGSRDDGRQDQRSDKQDTRSNKREPESHDPQGYGYGYERRQQQQDQGDNKAPSPRQPRR